MNTSENQPQTALVLRCCAADMSAHSNFIWPGVGEVAECPDWVDNTECGNGLHGWLYGQGDYSTSNYAQDTDARWLVVEVEFSTIRMLGGKCKFPRGTVRFVGGKGEAAAYIAAHEPRSAAVAIIGHHLIVGDGQAATVGALGTATAGDSGTATAGYRGTATAGDRGTATAGYSGTATAGYRGELRIKHWNVKAERYRTKVAWVGEGGIKANTPYRLDDNGNFFEVTA